MIHTEPHGPWSHNIIVCAICSGHAAPMACLSGPKAQLVSLWPRRSLVHVWAHHKSSAIFLWWSPGEVKYAIGAIGLTVHAAVPAVPPRDLFSVFRAGSPRSPKEDRLWRFQTSTKPVLLIQMPNGPLPNGGTKTQHMHPQAQRECLQ